jgi:hypothetical protein
LIFITSEKSQFLSASVSISTSIACHSPQELILRSGQIVEESEVDKFGFAISFRACFTPLLKLDVVLQLDL